MNKAELIHALSDITGLTQVDTEKTLNAFIDTVMATVASGEEVKLSGFGTFKLAHRAARVGHKPGTGEAIHIAARAQPKFAAGATFKHRVNGQ